MNQTSTSTKTQPKVKFPSMWKVVLHNDDYTPFSFVIQLLQLVFNKSSEESETLAFLIHQRGAAGVGLFTKEIAITKSSIVIATAEKYGFPLMATAEEA
jgi:ATP-dependent Clp protease adaptor protein ClpS